jgi:phosphopantothenoylcysteine decarboxylase/phosphopantothenate--cysteine ligase
MWEHPATQKNVATLKERGVRFAGPTIGPLADATEGAGRMDDPAHISQLVEDLLRDAKPK